MTKKKNHLAMKDAFKVLSFLFAAVLVSACSKKIVFPTSEVVPAAEVVLEVEPDDNDNYKIELEVDNLASPRRLTPPRRTYAVWAVTERNGTINLGNLNVSDDNNASLKATTPFKPIRVFITAEDDRNVVTPSTQVVLNSDNFEVD